MRFNKNFANVYTPYHEFEYIALSLEDKKSKRMEANRQKLEAVAALAPAPMSRMEQYDVDDAAKAAEAPV